jgi:hypothetical protein
LCDTDGRDGEALRRKVAERWIARQAPAPYWLKLKAELAELNARLRDADDAYYVRRDLDGRRHGLIVDKLTLHIGQLERAVLAAEPELDTVPMRDRDFATRRWDALAVEGRRELVRFAWGQILLVKAAKRGGAFGEGRIIYVPHVGTQPRARTETDR